jgi:sulfur carrier protein
MTVKLIVRKKEHDVPAGLTVQQAIRQIGLHPEAYLAMRDGEMIAEDEVLREGDTVKLIAVISGGSGA